MIESEKCMAVRSRRAASRRACAGRGTSLTRIALYGWLLVAAPFATAFPAHAEARPTQSALGPRWVFPEFEQATEALAREDCRRAWDVMWPLAKRGPREARYLLWMLTAGGRVLPPGSAHLPEDLARRRRLTLYAYAAAVPPGPVPWRGAPDHRWARTEIPLMISKLKQDSNTEQVARCYRSGPSLKLCLELGLSRGVVQDFDTFAAEIDDMVGTTGAKASCLPHPW